MSPLLRGEPASLLPSPQQGHDAAGAARPEAAAPVRPRRFAPEHPLSQILANQSLDADARGDQDRIEHFRQL